MLHRPARSTSPKSLSDAELGPLHTCRVRICICNGTLDPPCALEAGSACPTTICWVHTWLGIHLSRTAAEASLLRWHLHAHNLYKIPQVIPIYNRVTSLWQEFLMMPQGSCSERKSQKSPDLCGWVGWTCEKSQV